MAQAEGKVEDLTDTLFFLDRPWVTIVWDDPVNLS